MLNRKTGVLAAGIALFMATQAVAQQPPETPPTPETPPAPPSPPAPPTPGEPVPPPPTPPEAQPPLAEEGKPKPEAATPN